ncbi:uncharacterized protein BJ212DRAFT_1418759 [Suillus subaureus]|uniref:Uncharacterized protein n=1 Tax=Suillus subaureus TaxID=48587 RepID=A0A9P7DGA6_9AGAM|nr:uncharacterized protein BJ212DRAFT_1418759 [Suillus subaureus]KAG1791643.1 hypothetical protein BJ212DRAFT_1418759 [Suillus subaureus]
MYVLRGVVSSPGGTGHPVVLISAVKTLDGGIFSMDDATRHQLCCCCLLFCGDI